LLPPQLSIPQKEKEFLMKLVIPPLVVEGSDGFINDVLGRKTYGQALLNLVTRSYDELVISLDGQWGEGKTTFIKMWQELLNNKNVPNIYIDAFAHDFVDDPFIAVASAITNYANKRTDAIDRKEVKDFIDTAKKVGSKMLSLTVKTALKAATLGVLSTSDIEEFKSLKEDIAKDISKVGGDLIGERLNSHSEDVELLSTFKCSLSELSGYLGSENGEPLIIIIDELDRCRPTYAVEILEKIKHLFSVPNVMFVLVMNKQQLEESIKSVYGQNIDSYTYLQKFITIETRLPKITSKYGQNDIKIYCVKLMKQLEIRAWGAENSILHTVQVLAEQFNLSLRQIEKVFSKISLFYVLSEERDFISPPLVSFLAVIKVKFPDIYEKLLYRTISFEDICKVTGLPSSDKFNFIKYYMTSESEIERIFPREHFKASEHGIPHSAVIPFFIQKLDMFNLASVDDY
jgi:hypothetical protein